MGGNPVLKAHVEVQGVNEGGPGGFCILVRGDPRFQDHQARLEPISDPVQVQAGSLKPTSHWLTVFRLRMKLLATSRWV